MNFELGMITPAVVRSWIWTACLVVILGPVGIFVGIFSFSICSTALNNSRNEINQATVAALHCSKKYVGMSCSTTPQFTEIEAVCKTWAECIDKPKKLSLAKLFGTYLVKELKEVADAFSEPKMIVLLSALVILVYTIKKGIAMARPPPPPAPNFHFINGGRPPQNPTVVFHQRW